MEDHDDETYALLEKLSKRWRLEEHGFLPETLKTAYLQSGAAKAAERFLTQ